MRVTYLGVSHLQSFIDANSVQIPLYVERVGLSSPVQELAERDLNSNALCIPHPAATFFARAKGESMRDVGVVSGDVLVVDRSLTAKHGDIIIASIHGEMTVKALELKPEVLLRPKNKAYSPIPVTEASEFEVFGVVRSVVRQLGNH
ncbi:translesion error-prone DNA polymerase V autoproteolytic subunit [Marinomonas transparens]|uniref:Translesion error-prone DNA polymerase V autoproteolytic subunit n=1 Tax=Marinomonas transparens TaxID=2795388 RepID=A0A934JR10_9GAMM|nr:translesion error-prone DNA polymerase V autoproteolytic subunit [Marinomonas transparens]MBJ7539098.1 translesion error-prone DNA polymerase V autoproteolytic subunit [Marinomonas transparens]